MSTVIHTTDATFEEDVLKSDVPVLLDFWAPWCSPCRAIGPILDNLATQVGDKARIVKMNIDDNPQVSSEFGVRSIPYLVIIKNGEVVAQHVGSQNLGQFLAQLG